MLKFGREIAFKTSEWRCNFEIRDQKLSALRKFELMTTWYEPQRLTRAGGHSAGEGQKSSSWGKKWDSCLAL